MLLFFVYMPSSRVTGILHFPARILPSSAPGSTPLSLAELVSLDNQQKRVELLQILQFPTDVNPGRYEVEVDVTPKKDKPGLNYWYRSLKPLQG